MWTGELADPGERDPRLGCQLSWKQVDVHASLTTATYAKKKVTEQAMASSLTGDDGQQSSLLHTSLLVEPGWNAASGDFGQPSTTVPGSNSEFWRLKR